jgi:FAD binding domain
LCAHHITYCDFKKIRGTTRRPLKAIFAKQNIDRTPGAKSICCGTGPATRGARRLIPSVTRRIVGEECAPTRPLGAVATIGVPKLARIAARTGATYPTARRRAPCLLTWTSTIRNVSGTAVSDRDLSGSCKETRGPQNINRHLFSPPQGFRVNNLSVAVIGAGIGGLATAAALRRVGIEVTVYEQARRFARIGAGIQLGCNAMKVLRAFGLEASLRAAAFYPRSWNNRDFDTGEVRFDMIFGEAAEERYGAPYLLAHRGDLHAALTSVVPENVLRPDHQLVSLEQRADGSVRLDFANGVKPAPMQWLVPMAFTR